MRRKFALMVSALLLGSCLVGSVQAESTNIVAFPGAEGGGKFATGGRGGEVYYVTNLNDSGPGSFREAVGTPNRIVVFAVGGTIELQSDVVVKSNVTVAGQTAPGGAGITLKGGKIGLGGENIILRFISSRPGEKGIAKDYDAFGGSHGSNCIVDHCSIGWANDEQWGLYSKNENATTQWSIIGPSNCFSYHSKGIHGFGVMFGRSNHTMHHNMIVHNISRNFRGKVVGEGVVDFVNNVIYDWGYQTAYGTIGHLNYTGNYLKMGPSTKDGYNYVCVDSTTSPENFKIYLDGNRMVDTNDSDYGTLSSENWTGITYGASNGRNEENVRVDTAFEMIVNGEDVSLAKNAESADTAYDYVLEYAGAGINATSRPAIDQQVMYEALTGTGSLTGARPYEEATEAQKETLDEYNIACGVEYEYPEAILVGAPLDTDQDGMPDEWERARGLNPYSKYMEDGALESNGDYCGLGYTNIEYYINDLTIDAFPEGVVTLSPVIVPQISMNVSKEVEAGEVFDVVIGVTNSDKPIYSQDLTIVYDKSQISFIEEEVEAIEPTLLAGINETEEGVRVLVGTEGGKVSQEGAIRLKFRANESITEETSVKIAATQVQFGVVHTENGTSEVLTSDDVEKSITIKPSEDTKPIDKEALSALIREAEELINEAVVGTEVGNYPKEAKEAFASAISRAKEVLETSETQQEVDSAVSALRDAIETFKDAQIKDGESTKVKEDINADGKVDVADLALAAYYYRATVQSPNWDNASVADLNGDEEVSILDIVLIATKILEK